MDEEEPCVRCQGDIDDEDVIYIRAQVDGKWGSHPICTPCWNKENPGRKAYRVKWNEDPDD